MDFDNEIQVNKLSKQADGTLGNSQTALEFRTVRKLYCYSIELDWFCTIRIIGTLFCRNMSQMSSILVSLALVVSL